MSTNTDITYTPQRFAHETLWLSRLFRLMLRLTSCKGVSPLIYAWMLTNLARIAREGLLETERIPTEAVLRLDKIDAGELLALYTAHQG